MLVYVICYGAAMLFAFSAHFTLSGMSLMFAALYLYLWEYKKSGNPLHLRGLFALFYVDLLLEALESSEGLELRDMGMLLCRICSVLECVCAGGKEVWTWGREGDRR